MISKVWLKTYSKLTRESKFSILEIWLSYNSSSLRLVSWLRPSIFLIMLFLSPKNSVLVRTENMAIDCTLE